MTSSQSASRTIARRISELREWVDRGSLVHDGEVGIINKYREDKSGHTAMQFSGAAHGLGVYYGSRGLLKAHDGDASADSDLVAAMNFYLWGLRLRVKSFYRWPIDNQEYLVTNVFPIMANLLAYYLCSGDRWRESMTWQVIYSTFTDNNKYIYDKWHLRSYEPFMVIVYCRLRKHVTPFDLKRLDLGVYQTVLDKWDNDSDLPAAMAMLCKYHLTHTVNTRDRDAEFQDRPFDLWPAEICAINEVRKMSGRKPVAVEHPLMNVLVRPFWKGAVTAEAAEYLKDMQRKHDVIFGRDEFSEV